MCLLCGNSVSKTHCFVIGLIVVGVLFSFGVTLAALGEDSHRNSKCKVEPALNLWMMTAGVSLLLTTTVVFIALVCGKSTKHGGNDDGFCCMPNLARKSIVTLGWAFCCGIFLVFWYMINFSLWIAGTYLSVITIQKMRQVEATKPGGNSDGCSLSVVGVASSSVIVIWTVFFGVCCRIVYRICDNSILRQQADDIEGLEMFGRLPNVRRPAPAVPRTKDSVGNIYDAVAND